MNQLDKSNDHGRNYFSNLYVKVLFLMSKVRENLLKI